MKKPLSIGIDDYKKIISKPYYYVDKTLMIKDLLDQGGEVSLFTRPRRFGKTLALSMLKTFFEIVIDENGTIMDNSHYFNGMKIMDCGDEYTKHMGKYPVIFLSLKSAKQPDFDMAYWMLEEQIASEFKRHLYVLDSDVLLEEERERYVSLTSKKAERVQMASSLKFLSDCLKKYHKQNVIILIDEYDVPLENAYFRGFYDQMTDFIRSLFESALKTNESLAFAVITGCLRISKESIFTGLNNLKIISLLNNNYAEYFGFTQSEINEMTAFYEINQKACELKKWYDGYQFGTTEVYNPWSVINYVADIVTGGTHFPKPYWSNTSSNSIIRELVEQADSKVKQEIEELIAGGTIKKPVHEDITYDDIHKSQDNLWNFLYFTGYLKMTGQRMEENTIYLDLKIPNEEIKYIYQNTIREWFQKQLEQADFKDFYQDIPAGNPEGVEEFISSQLFSAISYYDNAENFYHGYLIGILSGIAGYEILSNREEGIGRPDILLKPFHPKMAAVIFEIKCTNKLTEMEIMCDAALTQIKERKYAEGLHAEGYGNIIRYGICFCKKSCRVKMGDSGKENPERKVPSGIG